MSQSGIGAMLHYLGGGSENAPDKYYGRKIVEARLYPSDSEAAGLHLKFDDGVVIRLWDDGQSCCESRYMTTDDDPAELVGQKLVKIEALRHEEKSGEYGDTHEMVFVEVVTELGRVVLVTHNEHNGYYGGFGLTITEAK